MDPIGIKTNIPVTEIDERKLLKEISLELTSSKRVAIIAKNKNDYTALNQSQVLVITPFESKGHEFNIVFVDPSEMSRNEKYISYTRALKKLYIIKKNN